MCCILNSTFFLYFNFTVTWIGIVLYFVALAVYSDVKKSEYKEDGLPVDIKLPVKHVLSKELQVYPSPCSLCPSHKLMF